MKLPIYSRSLRLNIENAIQINLKSSDLSIVHFLFIYFQPLKICWVYATGFMGVVFFTNSCQFLSPTLSLTNFDNTMAKIQTIFSSLLFHTFSLQI